MAANFFDQFDQSPSKPDGGDGNFFDQFDPATAQPEPKRTLGGTARDIGVTALKGAVGLPQAAVGLLDIPTGGYAGKAIEGAGVRFKDAQDTLDTMYSPAQQEANRKVREADGFLGTAKAMLENPSTIATGIGESLPQMIGGAGVARGAMALAPKLGPVLAGALGEGVVGAGSAAEQVRGQTQDGLLTGKQAALAGASGLATAGLGALGGKVAQRVGVGDVDTMLAQGAARSAGQGSTRSMPRQIAEGAVAEGVLEEMPQSMAEQALQNVALDKPVGEGVGAAAAQGLITGTAMGGAGGAIGASGNRAQQRAQEQAAQSAEDPAQAPAGAAPVDAAPSAMEPATAQPDTPPGAQDQSEPVVQDAAAPTSDPVTPEQRIAQLEERLSFIQQQAKGNGWDQRLIGARDEAMAELDALRPASGASAATPAVDPRPLSEQMGIDRTAGPLSKIAATAVDTGATPVQFLGATGRALQTRQTGPGVTNESNVIDVQGRVVDERAIPTPRRLIDATQPGASQQPAGRQALPAPANLREALDRIRQQRAEGERLASPSPAPGAAVPALGGPTGDDGARSPSLAIPDGSGANKSNAGRSTAAGTGGAKPGTAQPSGRGNGNAPLRAPTSLREGLERIRAQRQEAANAKDAAQQAAAPAQALPAARAPALEAAGPAPVSPTTTGVTNGPEAAQTQQGIAQPTQAGGAAPAAPAATPAAGKSATAGGSGVQAARVEDAITTAPQVVEVKDNYGRTHRVRQSDLYSNADRIPTLRKNGDVVAGEEIPRSIIKDAPSVAETPPANESANPAKSASTPAPADRHPNWRKNAIQAGRVARELGLEPKGKRLAQVVAEIDAADARQPAPASSAKSTPVTRAGDVARGLREGIDEVAAPDKRPGMYRHEAQRLRKAAEGMDSTAEVRASFSDAADMLDAWAGQGSMFDDAPEQPASRTPEIRYELPPEKSAQQQGDESWMAAQSPSFKPTARQQLLMDAVAKALDDGAFRSRDLEDRVAQTLGVTPEQRARNSHNVDGGDFGYDVYGARKAVEAQRESAKSREFSDALSLKPGDALGTLVFNDGKVTTGVKVVSLNESGLIATITGKRGAATLNGEVGVDAIVYAIDRAKERGKRSDGYAEFVESKVAPIDAAQQAPAATKPVAQPITRADVTAAQQQAATLIAERIDAMTAGEVNTIARRFLPTMGVKPTVSKERNKAAVTDFTKVNPMAAAAEFGVTLPADVRRALDAEMQGKVVDAGQDDGVNPRVPRENRAQARPTDQGEQKEPWQMTAMEFGQQERGNPHWNQSYAGKDDGAYLADVQATHARLVQEAVDAGLVDATERPAATKQEADEQQARADNRKAAKQGAAEEAPISDFGEKLEGARKDMPPSLKEEVSDEKIASLPLSKIWPSDAHESIEDDAAAALVFAARKEIPAKPRVPSRLREWVSKVKMFREVARDLSWRSLEGMERHISMSDKFKSLAPFFAKVRLLSQLPRDTWGRVERVGEYPNAIRYEKDGSKTAVAFSSVTIDGKSRRFEGVGKIGPDEVQAVKEMLGTAAPKKDGLTAQDFEVRGTAKTGYKINRKGDSEYRSLKIFTGEDAAKKALAWRDEHTAELEAAWEAVKARDNVSKADVRRDENRERTGENRRNGRDVTAQMFTDAFGFRGAQFGNWVGQGAGAKSRQGMLNDAYDALLDLSDILGIPSRAISLNGTLGLSFGARGSGKAAAHFEPSNLVINLTKTRGAGSLAHEWFHALDNYFSRMRGGEVAFTGDNNAYRKANYVTYKPEAAWGKAPITPYTNFMRGGQLRERLQRLPGFSYDANKTLAENAKAAGFERDPNHKDGVRPQVEKAFADLVQALNESPMAKRASSLDKAADGYWGRIIERGARSFENYVISKMAQRGWSNDFLANIRSFDEWMAMGKNAERYPYLKPEEDAPIVAAFDKLFETVETRETEGGNVAMFSRSPATQSTYEARIDALFAGEDAGRVGVRVLDRSDVLGLLGHPGQPVILAEGKVRQGQDSHQRMTAATWKKVPEWLENPAAVFASDTVPGRLVFIAPEMVNGSPVRMIVEPDTKVGGLQVHLLVNAFDATGRTPWMRWAQDGLARYIDKKKFPAILAPSGLQLSRVEQALQGTGRILSEKHLAGYRRANNPAFSFAGARAATADAHALVTAQARLNAGEDAEDVRKDTGWFKGNDGKWRFEIDDSRAFLKGTGTFGDVVMKRMAALEQSGERKSGDPVRLGDVLRHESLFAAYPALRDIEVQFTRRGDTAKGRLATDDAGVQVIHVRYELDDKEALSVLLHEIQHGIQTIEGFATGGTPQSVAPILEKERFEAMVNRDDALTAEFDVLKRQYAGVPESEIPQEVANQVRQLRSEINAIRNTGWREASNPFARRQPTPEELFAGYTRLAGEVEARNTQSRQKLTAAQRRATAPGQTADVSDADVIVVFNGKDMANAPMPANAAPDAAATTQPLRTPAATPPADSNARNAATQTLVDGLKAKWTRAPEIIVARNMQDPQIPQRVRDYDAKLKSQGATGETRGFIYQGQVYLLSDHLKGPQQIAEVLFHEVLGHYGLRGAFGKSLDAILMKIGTMRRRDVVAKAREYGLYDKDALGDVDQRAASVTQIWEAMSAKQRLEAAEEVLAELAQSRPEISFVRQAISAIRNWLRANVPGFNKLALTDADIIQAYILPARGYVTRSQETPQQSIDRAMMAFSRTAGDQTQTEAFKRWFAGSKVVDADGKPLVVYHGTRANFNVFGNIGGRFGMSAGYYFASSTQRASVYADGLANAIENWNPKSKFTKEVETGANVMPVYLSIKNPLVITNKDGPFNSPEDAFDLNGGALVKAAKDLGHDGVIYRREKGDGFDEIAAVAFRPEQVKSATGNRGTFDPANPDIRFSRSVATDDYNPAQQVAAERAGAAIKAVSATNLKQRADWKATDYLGLGLQTLGRRQIVDIYGDALPLAQYNKLAAQMEADKNEVGANADKLATAWGKLKDERQLAELMHDATLAQMDPAKEHVPGDDQMRYKMLRARFNALTPEAKQVYLDARSAYQTHHANVRQAIKDRIERSELKGERKAALLKQMDDEFFKAVKGVYFPLARFGQYVVVVKDADGKVASVNRAETMAEAQALRGSLLKAFPAGSGHTVARPILGKEFIAGRDAVGRGFMTELYAALDKQDMDAAARAELEDTLGQLYLSSLPDLSWAKHGIHRKGTPGFSQDARRAYAQNMFHGARYLAKLRYSDLMQDELNAMQQHVDDWKEVEDFDQPKAQRVVDEMNKRHESLMNPKSNPLSTALTSFGFIFHLGLSPASAMVNLSQTALVAYPIMGAKWGFGKASAALLKASGEAARGKNDITGALTAQERQAYDEAVRTGVIDVTMAHDLAGISQGEDAGVMWKLRPVMKWASFMFHHAERFNRQVTFVAAYRLAREAGASHESAYEQAADATYKGHFDYSAGNRARIMQGNTARVLLLFKQYSQNMIYTLARSAHQSLKGATPEARAEARRALGGLLTMHAAAAGVLGLPMVSTLLAAASMLGGDDDEPWDAQVALQNLLADTFGQKSAEVLAHGLSRLTPWDVSGRVGLDRLIFPDVQEGLEGQRLAESAMAAALGPVAGIGVNVLKGVQEMSQGRYLRGLEAMAPSVARGPLKALRYESEGVKDKTGIVVQDEVDAAALWGQVAGFSPSDVRRSYEGKSAIVQHDRALQARRSALVEQFAMAAMAGDETGKTEAREDIAKFNEKNPARRILPLNLMQSVAQRQKRIREAREGVYLPAKRRDAMEQGRFAAPL